MRKLLQWFLLPAIVISILAVARYSRTLLLRVVQVCQIDQAWFGNPFPCVKVETEQSSAASFVIMRAPLVRTHVLVSPTRPITGIENRSLQAPTSPNYVEDAWEARTYVARLFNPPLPDGDIGVAVNSRHGRSQDQLHIHVSCVQRHFIQQLRAYRTKLNATHWRPLPFAWGGVHYWARLLLSPSLAHVNAFAEAATILKSHPATLHNLTFAILPISLHNDNGFFILDNLYAPGYWRTGHAEFLLDDNCSNR